VLVFIPTSNIGMVSVGMAQVVRTIPPIAKITRFLPTLSVGKNIN
jgi:ABC-type proline/glycine betaine transport system permease subunit